ncbi:hypothetical protein MBLNU457_g0872t1 [Dothideomycetes sp. NU457]
MSLSTWIYYAAPAVGLLVLAQGVFALLRPVEAGSNYGIEISASNPQAMAFVKVYGSRNMSLGTAILALFFLRRYREMGVVIMCLNIATILDAGVIATDVGGKRGNVLPSIGASAVLAFIWGSNLGMYW